MLQGNNRRPLIITVTVILIVTALLVALLATDLTANPAPKTPDVFVGVDVGFGDESYIYKVVDEVQGYANLIIIGSLNVTKDTTKLTTVCDYLYQKGFYFIVYVGFAKDGLWLPQGPDMHFFNNTARQWGDKLLGVYLFDEPGGKQLDYSPYRPDKIVKQADNISDAALHYIFTMNNYLSIYTGNSFYGDRALPRFTSDYGLFWFDYQSGYDVIFGEFVGNQSRQLSLALTRGAANTLGNKWGTMITWKYEQPPYIEEPDQLYADMVLAYENGAKYIIVFNSPGNNTATTTLGILTSEHVAAIKDFSQYTKTHPAPQTNPADTAYVLPSDYGYGFRGPNDTLWGLWPADNRSATIWSDTTNLLTEYGKQLDIVYEATTSIVYITPPYSKLIYWNGTTIQR